MHFTCDVPSPIHAIVALVPWDYVVQECDVPNPVRIALILGVLEEKWAST